VGPLKFERGPCEAVWHFEPGNFDSEVWFVDDRGAEKAFGVAQPSVKGAIHFELSSRWQFVLRKDAAPQFQVSQDVTKARGKRAWQRSRAKTNTHPNNVKKLTFGRKQSQ
jgi:hypothetical protein